MANSESSVSSSSSEKFRLVDLKLPTLNDKNIKTQVQQTHRKGYAPVLRHPLLVSICHILKPATNFLDSILLDNKVSEKWNELETSYLSGFNSMLSELSAFVDHHCFSIRTLLAYMHRRRVTGVIPFQYRNPVEFLTISKLSTLARDDCFMNPTFMMDRTANNAMQMLDEVDVQQASIDLLEFLSGLSWDAKAVNTMGCFVFKFLELLGFLLHGQNQPLTEIASSMADLMENPVSIMGSPLEKFQVPLYQLNSLIKLTLEVIQYISELTLLSDTEYSKEELLSTSAYWAILSVVACCIQITLLMHNGEAALELSHLISNLSHILNDLKRNCTICKPQIEEMDVHLQRIAVFEDAFGNIVQLPGTTAEMSELMKSFMYSKDGCHSLIDGSTMSKVDLEVLKEKAIIFFISDLDKLYNTYLLEQLHDIYEEIKEEDYYKIVWVPFVLKWTEELRQKFENLKSKMPWYIVCYDSPISGLWFIKGRWFFSGKCRVRVVDLGPGYMWPNTVDYHLLRIYDNHFPFKRFFTKGSIRAGGAPPTLLDLYPEYSEPHQEDVNQNKPSSGFQGLLAKTRRGSLNPKEAKLNPAHATFNASLTTGNVKQT